MHPASAPSPSGERSDTFGPPTSVGAIHPPDAAARRVVRRTAIGRPTISAVLYAGVGTGLPPTDPYVRRFWIPILGPGAVADVLRLTAAARSGRPLKLPIHITAIIAEGFARWEGDAVVGVRDTIPLLEDHHLRRLPPSIRRLHQRHRAAPLVDAH